MTADPIPAWAMDEAGKALGSPDFNRAMLQIRVARALVSVAKTERERAAKLLNEIADFLRHDADKIIAEWTGADLDLDDRQANRAFARERRNKAAIYDEAATAILADDGGADAS